MGAQTEDRSKATPREILVAEDDDDTRDALVSFLSDAGFRATGACTGAEVLERLDQDPPKLLLLDMWLSDTSGLDLLDLMVARSALVPTILVSGDPEAMSVAHRRPGRQTLIGEMRKPIDCDALLRLVEAHVGTRVGEGPT